ncbi:MAG: UDP-N-acetylmuramoyl-tripeptide--D-alanyl-D-alanine ligase [Syntrophus sp. SKADARSKE-3]|nr:UDP-N-acetylmuramoyl-tripeptide--D-alanyl-D-alanine ligase [Syntrophus sp. SKADARSKE-3]
MTTGSAPELSVGRILAATRGKLIRGRDRGVFTGLGTDSRRLNPGFLYVALKGERFDGHDYLDEAMEKGAGGFLVHRDDGKERGDAPSILVEDTLVALGDIAHDWRRAFSIPVIAVTGSSGKTTTKEMAACILSRTKNILKTQGNFNNLIGLPLTLMNLTGDHEIAIVELGTNKPGEIARLTEIAEPDITVITNIGPAHLEGFGSMDGVWSEKSDIFRFMPAGGTAVINLDDDYIRQFAGSFTGKCVTFGFGNDADVTAQEIRYDGAKGVRFTLRIREIKNDVVMTVSGRHNISNALAAAALAWAAGASYDDIRRGLEDFKPVAGRMEIIPLKNGAFVINDAYNANPASVGEALNTLQTLKGRGKGIAILGDMLELGDEAEIRHRDIGGLLADTEVNYAYLRGRLAQATAAGALDEGMIEGQVICFTDPVEIMNSLLSRIGPGDWILVKGSRQMKMEELVEHLVAAVGRLEGTSSPVKEGKA